MVQEGHWLLALWLVQLKQSMLWPSHLSVWPIMLVIP